MRNLIVAVAASAGLLAVSFPTHASAYNCSISKDDAVVKSCTIEAGGQLCTFNYEPDLIGVCGAVAAQEDKTQELLICGVVKPGAEQRLMSGNEKLGDKENMAALREQPGFLTRAITIVRSGSPGLVFLNYQESETASVLSLLCGR